MSNSRCVIKTQISLYLPSCINESQLMNHIVLSYAGALDLKHKESVPLLKLRCCCRNSKQASYIVEPVVDIKHIYSNVYLRILYN